MHEENESKHEGFAEKLEILKILTARDLQAFDNEFHKHEHNRMRYAIETIKELVPPSCFILPTTPSPIQESDVEEAVRKHTPKEIKNILDKDNLSEEEIKSLLNSQKRQVKWLFNNSNKMTIVYEEKFVRLLLHKIQQYQPTSKEPELPSNLIFHFDARDFKEPVMSAEEWIKQTYPDYKTGNYGIAAISEKYADYKLKVSALFDEREIRNLYLQGTIDANFKQSVIDTFENIKNNRK